LFLHLCVFLSSAFSRFSISVALAGNIAGKARNNPPMPGTELFRDNARSRRDQSSKNDSDGIVVPPCLPESRNIDLDPHDYLTQRCQIAKATPNHKGIEQIVVTRALTWYRTMIQLTNEA
jgi:hypothetical protein